MDIYPTTIEIARLIVTADTPLTDATVVEVAQVGYRGVPESSTTWVPATWVGEPGLRRICEVLVTGRQVTTAPANALRLGTRGRRQAFIRLPQTTEQIIRPTLGVFQVH